MQEGPPPLSDPHFQLQGPMWQVSLDGVQGNHTLQHGFWPGSVPCSEMSRFAWASLSSPGDAGTDNDLREFADLGLAVSSEGSYTPKTV